MFQIHKVSVKNQRTYFTSLVCIGLVVILFQCFLLKIVIVGTPRSKLENHTVHSIMYFNPPSHVDPQKWSFSTCRIPHCRFTTDRRELNTSKAVNLPNQKTRSGSSDPKRVQFTRTTPVCYVNGTKKLIG